MFKRLFSLSNPLGIAFTTAALILTLSPEARKGTRKMLVKGAAALLSVGDQVKVLTIGARNEVGHLVEEAKVEKEKMTLPDFSDMIKTAGNSTKTKMDQVFADMKTNVDKTPSYAMEIGGELMGNVQESRKKPDIPPKIKNKHKNFPVNKNVQNVLSDNTYHSLIGKPPFQ